MPIKKSELYGSLWKSCDELRGGMDASQYKDYVLVLLFVKYVSDKASSQKGYDLEVPKGGSFADMVALKGDKEIGDKINKIIAKLATANDLKGVIDVADFNDPDKLGKGKEMVDRLSNLVTIFDSPALDFRGNRAEGDDLLGDAYEYLMRHFATESGKSKGQFYTPAEVSRVMAKVIGMAKANDPKQTIYDPTCGSGSLLLKAHDEAKAAAGLDLAVYGQEMDNATYALARMNLILHHCSTAEIWKDNTLFAPHFLDEKTKGLKTFDFVVANPPFSTKSWSNGLNPAEDLYDRFELGVPPQKNGDYAFLLHVLASLKSRGKAAIILPHGVLFRGNAEAGIRRNLVERGFIKAIIGLPASLFYGTGIPACIIVLDKENANARRGVFMIDASKGFLKGSKTNRLRAQDIHKIVDTFERLAEVPRYSRMVPVSEIADPKNDFNLNLPRYIDTAEPEDLQDIEGHLRGGIPDRDIENLSTYWRVLPGVRKTLFAAERKGYQHLKVPLADVTRTIFDHPEFTRFKQDIDQRFQAWRKRAAVTLRSLDTQTRPKVLIRDLAEDLLTTFADAPLVDAYDLYQHLMHYWDSAMQDDVYLLVGVDAEPKSGSRWVEAAKPRVMGEADKKSKEKPDLVVGKQKLKMELVPPELIVARWFAADRAAIDTLEAKVAKATQALEELAEEHSGEEGLLEDAKTDKGKLTKSSVAARLNAIKKDKSAADERKVLEAYTKLLDAEAAASAEVKTAEEALAGKVLSRYATLSQAEVESLVVDDKWLGTVATLLDGELSRTSRSLAGRVRELAERYATPLPTLVAEVDALSAKVEGHLRKMGMVWA
jgi:type I restriction enzyme M protein